MNDTDIDDIATPQADLHIIGEVQRMRGWLYEYGDVLDGSGKSLATLLLAYFEDQKVEIMVRILED